MQEIDYIVVGLGLSGIAFCEQLEAHSKSYLVFDVGQSASKVSGGVYNPVILKRYTLPWKAEELMDYSIPHYKKLNTKLHTQIQYELAVLKIFSSVEDQNNWFEALDKTGLSRFLNKNLIKAPENLLKAPYKLGKVQETGRIDVPKLLEAYRSYLREKECLVEEHFNYSAISKFHPGIIYQKNIKAKKVVFAEGYGIKNNPFFNKLPLVGNKGEYLIIKAPDLELSAALKAHFFIIPLGKAIYKVGATFNWKEKDTQTTAHAREEIVAKLDQTISCSYEIVGQEAGVRPTTGDRRALLGTHPEYPNLALLNGMGTRGIMMAPYLAKMLYNHLENGQNLDASVDIMRFPKKF